ETYPVWRAAVCGRYGVCHIYDGGAAGGQGVECLVLDNATVCSGELGSEEFSAGEPCAFPLLLQPGTAGYLPAGQDDLQHCADAGDEPCEPAALPPDAGQSAGAGGLVPAGGAGGRYEPECGLHLPECYSGTGAAKCGPDGGTGFPPGDTDTDDAEQPGAEGHKPCVPAGMEHAGTGTAAAGRAGSSTGADTLPLSVAG